MRAIKNYINGTLSSVDATIDLIDPSKGSVYGSAPRSQVSEAVAAIEAAKQAFPDWNALGVEGRNKYLYAIAQRIDERADELAMAESLDNGKPLKLAQRVDIPRASSNIRFFAEAVTQFHGKTFPMQDGSINYTVHDPLGVVTCISPWNLPLYLLTWKIAPALAMGNTVVAKPSEVTPLTAYLLSEICMEVGLPAGVLNIVHGYGHELGSTLVEHQDVQAVSFTGSTKTGQIIAETAASHFKKVSLEMGGKNPNIIFADCNYESMLHTSMHSSFANQGEICLCGSRILVQQELYEQFKSDFVAKTKALKVGVPTDSDTKVGAIVSKEHYDKILSYIELAKEEGGKILAGGAALKLEAPHEMGYYIQPTVIEGLNQSCRTNQEEIFGPVVTIESFTDEADVIAKANATKYGLSATIWTQDVSKAHRVSRSIEAGIVWVNTWLKRDLRTPFGGVKQSGVGREGGLDALEFFSEVKNICINI